jgi:large conductance mechanosensitive channel
MGMISEFKDFINKGNVMDLAVGVVIGGAFGKIVDSFVSHLINPIVGMFTGGGDLSHLAVKLGTYTNEKGEVVPNLLQYGSFLTSIINFLILALVIFMVVKAYNNFRKAAPPEPPPASEVLLGEIRDLLKK